MPLAVDLASGQASKHLDAFIDGPHGMNVKALLPHRIDHILAQHQMLDVGLGNQHALLAGQSAVTADIEKSFDFFIGPADRLDLAVLIDRAGYGQGLADGYLRDRRQQRIQFG